MENHHTSNGVDPGGRFIELMGRHAEEDGMPRIAGRLMGALLLNEGPASLDELTEQLGVSKASISSNARLLEVTGVAERVTLPGDRRDYYQISDNAHERVLLHQITRIRILQERLEVGAEAVEHSSRPVRERMSSWRSQIVDMLERLEAELRRIRSS